MSKHTPEPWYAVRDPSHFDSLSTVVGGSNQELVVQVGGNAPIEEQEANTHLIAAAPDLLEALRLLMAAYELTLPGVRYIAVQNYQILNDAPCAARAAIAKAEGGGR